MEKLSITKRKRFFDWGPFSVIIWTVCIGKSVKGIRSKIPPKKDSRSGYHNRYEPITTKEVNESPSVLFNFHEVGCLEFCRKFQEVKSHLPLTYLFALRLQGKPPKHKSSLNILWVNSMILNKKISQWERVLGLWVSRELWRKRKKER